MDKINEIKIEMKKICEDILKRLDKLEKKDSEAIEKIISKDNTEPIFILAYLKSIKKLREKDLINEIEKYKFFLSEELIKANFPEFTGEKISSSRLFKNIIDKIINYNNIIKSKNLTEEKILFYKSLFSYDIKCEKIKGDIDYKQNKELAIYYLFNKIREGLIKCINKINNYQINEENEKIKEQKKIIEEGKIFKKVENYKLKKSDIIIILTNEEIEIYESIIKLNKNYNADEVVKKAENKIIFISKIDSEDFLIYLDNYSTFLSDIKLDFENKFKDLENLNDIDFGLLIDFCFFLEFYDFKSESLYFYIKKWKNTFSQTEDYIIKIVNKKQNANFYTYDSKNNKLTFKLITPQIKEKNFKIINNIDKYCIDCIMYYFNKYDIISNNKEENNDIDSNDFIIYEEVIKDYSIENLLKFDSINNIYIYKKRDIIDNYLIKIFTSNTFKTLFNKLNNDLDIDKPYNFLNKKDLQIILQNSRIFQFKTEYMGITAQNIFTNYIYYGGIKDSYSENISKLLNIIFYKVAQEKEIFGNLNIKIQNYLLEKEIKDSNKNNNNFSEFDGIIQKLLYDRIISILTYNEILFILDEENYNVNYEIFKNKFLKCNEGIYKISDSLSNLLTLLDIKISNTYEENEYFDITSDLIKKISKDTIFFFNRKRHTHYDFKKETELIQDLIKQYQSYENSKENKK